MVQDTLEETKKLVWPEIERYLKDPDYHKDFRIPNKYLKDINYYWKIVREYPERKGKYIRPTLILLTAQALGAKTSQAVKTAAAMQLSEDWLLIHDDIQDHSQLRRGRPTLHKIYGNELALNAGDTLHIIMWKILHDNSKLLSGLKSKKILEEFYRMLKRTSDGQAIEIIWSRSNNMNFSDKDWFFIADGKTAYYTIAGPLRLGAIIAGATQEQLDYLTNLGLNLGRCFQLVDDLLDITATYKGKEQKPGNDIYESKRTLILSHLVRTSNGRDKIKIQRIISKSPEEKTEKEVSWIIDKMHEYKSVEYAGNLAKRFRNRAREIFEKRLTFISREPARTKLSELIDFILERKY